MKKKILHVYAKYHYADPFLGYSYEYYQHFDTLLQFDEFEVKEFDWVLLSKAVGKTELNRLLLQEVELYKPDLVFLSFVRDEFDKQTISKITQKTLTLAWFADDTGRFNSYIKYWLPHLSWASTVSESMIQKYLDSGFKNIIYTQFAVNNRLYTKLNLPYKWNTTFVGQPHGNRKRIIKELTRKGLDIHTWGWTWKSGLTERKGHLEFSEMIRVFNQSKINLNFTPISFNFKTGTRLLPWFLQPDPDNTKNITAQMNGRIFEVPGCGGFLLTGDAPELSRFYKLGKEIVVYHSISDLNDKIKYYLKHDKERERIAQAGFKRTLKDHTYKKRFTNIFKKIGLLV